MIPESLRLQNWPSELLKVFVLALFAFPLLSTVPLQFLLRHLSPVVSGGLAEILAGALITFILWFFCLLNSGLSKLLDYLSGAFILATTTVLIGAIIRLLLPVAFSGEGLDSGVRLLKLFYNIIMVVPFSLLAINAFSAQKLIDRISLCSGRYREFGLHLALVLRIFQHVGDVILRLLAIWKEEHPLLVMPRQQSDFKGVAGVWCYCYWVLCSVRMWIFACIILTFEPIPLMVQEIEQIFHAGENND